MSKKPKLTPEFPAEVEPVRKGIYLCRWRCGEWYSLWDGEWHWGGSTPDRAYRNTPIRGGDELISWRGLAKNPAPGAGHAAVECHSAGECALMPDGICGAGDCMRTKP